MTSVQLLITILLMALATCFLRFCVFFLFPSGKNIPGFITWLGSKLPKATMAMLVIYCLKDVRFTSLPQWAPSMIAVAATAALHVWKKQLILSIVAGTAVYMVLIRLIV